MLLCSPNYWIIVSEYSKLAEFILLLWRIIFWYLLPLTRVLLLAYLLWYMINVPFCMLVCKRIVFLKSWCFFAIFFLSSKEMLTAILIYFLEFCSPSYSCIYLYMLYPGLWSETLLHFLYFTSSTSKTSPLTTTFLCCNSSWYLWFSSNFISTRNFSNCIS